MPVARRCRRRRRIVMCGVTMAVRWHRCRFVMVGPHALCMRNGKRHIAPPSLCQRVRTVNVYTRKHNAVETADAADASATATGYAPYVPLWIRSDICALESRRPLLMNTRRFSAPCTCNTNKPRYINDIFQLVRTVINLRYCTICTYVWVHKTNE